MKSYDFLFWAYNVIWLGLVGYLGLLFYRLNRTRGRVERLEKLLADREEDGG